MLPAAHRDTVQRVGVRRRSFVSEPIVFISHFGLKEGRLEGFKQYFREGASLLKVEKPRTAAFLAYFDKASGHVAIVHVFPDAAAMELHVEGAGQRAQAAYEFITPAGFEIYGTPSGRVLEIMRRSAESQGAGLTIEPAHLGGFIRLTSSS
jgi:hypothetical protein